jgi:hypothetical protein
MHTDAAFGAIVVERDVGQHRLAANRAIRHRE